MNVINVGFNSKNWNILVEGSDEYKSLSISVDDGDSKTVKHILNTIESLNKNDFNTAYREAHYAIKTSKGLLDKEVDPNTVCPFCDGDGVIEFEHVPFVGGYQDPADAVDVSASCDACGGEGVIDSSDLLERYASDTYPEHVVMSVVKGEMVQARELAKAVTIEIMSHEKENFDKSVDSLD